MSEHKQAAFTVKTGAKGFLDNDWLYRLQAGFAQRITVAGICPDQPFLERDRKSVAKCMEINVLGTYFCLETLWKRIWCNVGLTVVDLNVPAAHAKPERSAKI